MTSTPYQTVDAVRRPGVSWIPFTYVNAAIATGDILVDFVPGYNFKLIGLQAVASTVVTTGSKAATITAKVDGTLTTGGALALTSANLTPLGAVVAGATLTDVNMPVGTPTSKIRLTASSVTTFSEGTTVIYIGIQNLDSAI